ncbi:MAG: hypothetical protein PHC33_01590 [Candidatus Omnitrophica bacterium]|nr:hypothetical protein [Candidatus Omnitrophota bacterium]
MMKRGLTLIEVCIATAVFAALLLSMLGVFHQGSRCLGITRERTVAMNLARGILEHYSDWDSLEDVSASVSNGEYPLVVPDLFPSCVDGEGKINGILYACTLTIAGGPYSPASLKMITATVGWSKSGKNFTVALSTMKADI